MKNIPDILKKIVETKKIEILEVVKDIRRFKQEAAVQKFPLNFKKAIYPSPKERTIVAEIKRASPSVGIISTSFNPPTIAVEYERGGANAVSVLTDRKYFKGNNVYLREVKRNIDIPVLRKDFIIAPEQIIESRAIGADSFLLISTILSTTQLSEFILMGREFNMEPLVEIHDEYDLEKAIEADADIIGINNRNLCNFTVNTETTGKLVPLIPSNKIIVAESGITSLEIAAQLYNDGANSLLVGEYLMQSENKAKMVYQIKNSV